MRVLVLGGSQFVGRRLVQELYDADHTVTVLNRGITSTDLPDDIGQVRADRDDPASMRVLNGQVFDAVFDISGYTPSRVSAALTALRGAFGQYLYISSVAVYRPAHILPISEDYPLVDDPLAREYNRNKVECESILLRESAQDGFTVSILRPPNIYGPYNHAVNREFAHFARLESGRPVLLPAEGLPLLPLVYVGDVAQAFLRCLGNPAAHGEAFNIASADVVTFAGWVHTMATVVGIEPKIVPVPTELEHHIPWSPDVPVPIESFPFNWHENAIYATDKARSTLGFVPTRIEDGLLESYRWYESNIKGKRPWDFSRDDACLADMERRAAESQS